VSRRQAAIYLRAAIWLPAGLLLAAQVGCSSGPAVTKVDPNPTKSRLTEAIAMRGSDTPIQLRYNPAACNCPAFEVRIAKRWVRAEWTNNTASKFAPKLQKLQASNPEQWPIAMLVQGQFESEIMRTEQGQHAVQVEVSKIIGDDKVFEEVPKRAVPVAPGEAEVPPAKAAQPTVESSARDE
jgi:hypothetical protein